MSKNLINKGIIRLIRLYQVILSPDTGLPKKLGLVQKQVCVFYPTCSEYSIGCFERFGTIKALILTIKRIIRCHPWQKEHIDPVPEK